MVCTFYVCKNPVCHLLPHIPKFSFSISSRFISDKHIFSRISLVIPAFPPCLLHICKWNLSKFPRFWVTSCVIFRYYSNFKAHSCSRKSIHFPKKRAHCIAINTTKLSPTQKNRFLAWNELDRLTLFSFFLSELDHANWYIIVVSLLHVFCFAWNKHANFQDSVYFTTSVYQH